MSTASPPASNAGPIAGPGDRRARRLDVAFVVAVAVVLRLPAFLAARHLTFDDGQYGSAILAMRGGRAPFRDLFSSQGPLHYPLLWAADLVGLRTLDGARILTVGAGAVAAAATYAIASRLAGRRGGVVAGILVATSGSILYVTAPLSGDGPALALALVAVAAAFAYRDRPSTARAAGIGIAMGAALGVKLLVAPAALPVGLLLLGRRRARDVVVAVGAAIAVLVAAALPWGIGRVWDQSVAYHQDSHRLRGYGGNVQVLLETLGRRDPLVVAAVLLALGGAAVAWWRARGSARNDVPSLLARLQPATWLLGLWLATQVLFLVVEPAMWRPHVSQVVAPLALLAALRPPPWRALAVVAVVLVPWEVGNVHDILWPESYSSAEQAVVDRMRALPAGAWVISDDPGFAWRAEREVPGNFVDVSEKRVRLRQLTAEVIAHAAGRPRVCAVLVWSKARFGSLATLPRLLREEGYVVARRYGGPRLLYERDGCEP